MRLHDLVLINESQQFSESPLWSSIDQEITTAIEAIVWPPGSGSFVIPPIAHGNGVKPIKEAFVDVLETYGWEAEKRISLVEEIRPGPVDIVKTIEDGSLFLAEWETGNISSSHRSINRMLTAVTERLAIGGAIVVTRTETLYPYLTDRIGNDRELRPYFRLWARYPMDSPSILAMYVVDYDGVDENVEPITKMTDGWALVQRKEP